MDSVFANWKEVETVNDYSSLSEEVANTLLDKEISKGQIQKSVRKHKNIKTDGSDDMMDSKWLTCLNSYLIV